MTQLTSSLRVGTLNVRGLSDRRRQCQLKRLILEKELDVVAIQETKIESEEQTGRMARQYQSHYNVCVSHAVGSSGGVCLMIKNKIGITIEAVVSSQDGRFVSCDFTFGDQKFRAVCVYGPPTERQRHEFFETVAEYLKCDRLLLLLGDFNCTCTPEDRSTQRRRGDSSGHALNQITNELLLDDVAYCGTADKGVLFTHFQGNSSHARLDRVYVSAELAPLCDDYRVDYVSFSDHCLVTCALLGGNLKKTRFEWKLWKFNNKLLRDEAFTEGVISRAEKLGSAEGQLRQQWEEFKQLVKLDAIERSVALKYEQKKEERQLRDTLETLLVEECRTPGVFIDDINDIKSKLESFDEERYKGAIVRSRAEKLVEAETPTKRALGGEKRYARANEIAKINYRGTISNEAAVIEQAFVEFYEGLFGKRTPQESFARDYLTSMPSIDSNEKEWLEAPISMEEILKAIDDLPAGKTPGPDGLSAAFYRRFKHELAPVLHRVFQECYNDHVLPVRFC